MAELPPSPDQTEFQKLSAPMLQYVFDLEQKVEQSLHVSHTVAVALVFLGLGCLVGAVL